jgi:hypothetical protein
VEGIPIANGFGCSQCKYARDRKRDVARHMEKFHGTGENHKATDTRVQVVFRGHLRSYFKVAETELEPLTQDEGLLPSIACRYYQVVIGCTSLLLAEWG